MRVKEIVKERFSGKVADWSIPMSYAPPPGKNSGAKIKTLDADAKTQAANKAKIEAAAAKVQAPDKQIEESTPEEKPEAVSDKKPMKRLSGAHTPFHHQAIETKKAPLGSEKIENKPDFQPDAEAAPPKIKVETDMQLSEDFRELDEIASAVEKTIPHPADEPKPEKW